MRTPRFTPDEHETLSNYVYPLARFCFCFWHISCKYCNWCISAKVWPTRWPPKLRWQFMKCSNWTHESRPLIGWFWNFLPLLRYQLQVLGQKPPDKKPPDKSHPDKSPPTISPRYKSPKKPKKNRGWIFFLGLVDSSQNRLVSTAYFAIISSILLRA